MELASDSVAEDSKAPAAGSVSTLIEPPTRPNGTDSMAEASHSMAEGSNSVAEASHSMAQAADSMADDRKR
jgi:hypothetical protein